MLFLLYFQIKLEKYAYCLIQPPLQLFIIGVPARNPLLGTNKIIGIIYDDYNRQFIRIERNTSERARFIDNRNLFNCRDFL